MDVNKSNIVYEGNALVVVNKDCNKALDYNNILNNLSKEVSGLVVLSKNKYNIKYSYLVIVEGYFNDQDYNILVQKEKYSILEITSSLEDTLIRENLMNINHPIIGDYKYKSTINPIKRICMHLYKIEIDNKQIHSEIPDSFKIFMP